MALDQLRNVNFGRNRANATGSTGVGYTVMDAFGTIVSLRTTVGVYQLASGTGLYAAYVSFPDSFRGQLVWDTGTAFPTASYAIEQYNVEENNPRVDASWQMLNDVTGSITLLRDLQAGRWRITSNKMQFFKEDNSTLVTEYDLFDSGGNPTMDAVFERRKV